MQSFTIDNEATYRVLLAKPVTRPGSVKLLPRDRHQIKGRVLAEIADASGWDAIDQAEAIDGA